jgi:hypothetical protein
MYNQTGLRIRSVIILFFISWWKFELLLEKILCHKNKKLSVWRLKYERKWHNLSIMNVLNNVMLNSRKSIRPKNIFWKISWHTLGNNDKNLVNNWNIKYILCTITVCNSSNFCNNRTGRIVEIFECLQIFKICCIYFHWRKPKTIWRKRNCSL